MALAITSVRVCPQCERVGGEHFFSCLLRVWCSRPCRGGFPVVFFSWGFYGGFLRVSVSPFVFFGFGFRRRFRRGPGWVAGRGRLCGWCRQPCQGGLSFCGGLFRVCGGAGAGGVCAAVCGSGACRRRRPFPARVCRVRFVRVPVRARAVRVRVGLLLWAWVGVLGVAGFRCRAWLAGRGFLVRSGCASVAFVVGLVVSRFFGVVCRGLALVLSGVVAFLVGRFGRFGRCRFGRFGWFRVAAFGEEKKQVKAVKKRS